MQAGADGEVSSLRVCRADRKHTSNNLLIRETNPLCLSVRAGEPELLELRVFFCLPTSRATRGKCLYFFTSVSPKLKSPVGSVSRRARGPQRPFEGDQHTEIRLGWLGMVAIPAEITDSLLPGRLGSRGFLFT